MKLSLAFVFLFAVSVQAGMVRVLRVSGPSAIVVADRDGSTSEVRLSGIEITDPQHAVAYLTWTLDSSWVMVENGRVYRSPDALVINDELVRRGFARSTSAAILTRTPATYLGELNPEPVKATAKQPATRAKAATPSRARPVLPRARPARARRRL